MKQLAITLAICGLSALATGALAAEEQSGLFACGVKFGNKELTYTVSSQPKSEKKERGENLRLRYIAGAVQPEPAMYIPPRSASSTKTEKRLPRKFTFATFGCSWR